MFKTFIISSETCQALVSFSHWKGFMFHAQFFDQLDSCLCCFQSVARRVIFVGQYSNFRGHNWPCIHVISNLEHSGQTSLLRDLDFFFLKRSCKHILDATLSLSLPPYVLFETEAFCEVIFEILIYRNSLLLSSSLRYVLYFLPPMGDGTLLSAERPYVVACAYATWLKTSSPKGLLISDNTLSNESVVALHTSLPKASPTYYVNCDDKGHLVACTQLFGQWMEVRWSEPIV